MRNLTRFTVLALASWCAALPARSEWYAGGAVGQARAQSSEGFAAQIEDLGFTVASASGDDRDRMYRIHGGYQFHRNFAIELGYVDLGRFRSHVAVTPAGFFASEIRNRAVDLSLVAMLPVLDKLSLFARAGAARTRTEARYSGGGSIVFFDGQQRQTRRSTGGVYGVGLTYEFIPNLGLRVEYARYDRLGDDLTGGMLDAEVASLGVQWRF